MVYIRCLGIDVVEVPSRGIATLIRVVIQPCGTDDFINKSNKRTHDQFAQDQPIVERDDGDWQYAEEEAENCRENCPGIDAEAAEVGYGAMDEDQDVYAHSA